MGTRHTVSFQNNHHGVGECKTLRFSRHARPHKHCVPPAFSCCWSLRYSQGTLAWGGPPTKLLGGLIVQQHSCAFPPTLYVSLPQRRSVILERVRQFTLSPEPWFSARGHRAERLHLAGLLQKQPTHRSVVGRPGGGGHVYRGGAKQDWCWVHIFIHYSWAVLTNHKVRHAIMCVAGL